MNRAALYLVRKKGKSITLFILIFLIATFVATSLALLYTTDGMSRFMRESIDGRIEVRQLLGQQFGQEEDAKSDPALPITAANISQIMTIPGIVEYNAYTRGLASSRDLAFRQGFGSSETDNMGSIQGVRDSAILTDFRNQRLSLIEGRHITPTDNNVVLISQTLAAENDLTIGDMVELRPAEMGINEAGEAENVLEDTALCVPATVIGIYTSEEVQINASLLPSAFIATNQMFSDHGLMVRLELATQGEYEAATFHIGNPSELPGIVVEIRQMDALDWDNFFLQHSDGDYMRISGDLQTVQNLLTILLVAICIVSIAILTLILILRMRGRIHEVGILLSVGLRKRQIWGSFLLEIIIIAVLSFLVSYAITSALVPRLNQSLLADLPALAELGQHQFQTMSPAMYALVYLLILSVILGTAYITTRLKIRLKPKQILSKMS